MISYIKGNITQKTPTFVVVETGGLGYHINISLNTYRQIEPLENVKLFTHLHIKEDSHTLYGFATEDERRFFTQLISVSGIGPNTAQVVLSSLEVKEAEHAILSENAQVFNQVKGIGPKTAKRIILDLKDKIQKAGQVGEIVLPDLNNTIREEALSALIALGFGKSTASRTVEKILKGKTSTTLTVEEVIKVALKQMT